MFIEGDIKFHFDDDSSDVNENVMSMTSSASGSNFHNRYNSGFEYKIVPLVHNLSQKGNDYEMAKHNDELYADDINIFDVVTGIAYKDSKEHRGIVTYITYRDGERNPKYIWILDDSDRQKYALYPDSCELEKSESMFRKKRMNVFATNRDHLHEGVDVFSDELKSYNESDNDFYKQSVLQKIDISEDDV